MRSILFAALLLTACANDAAPVVDLSGPGLLDIHEEVSEAPPETLEDEGAISLPCTDRCALTCPMGTALTGCSSYYEELWCECTDMMKPPGEPDPSPFPKPTPMPPLPPPPPY